MRDDTIFGRINDLAAEEERLWRLAADGSGIPTADQARMEEIRVELDQCYDLLHQRQGRRDAGLDPDEAKLRTREAVERYQQ